MKNLILALVAVLILAVAAPAHAQRGCRGSCINGGFNQFNNGFGNHGAFVAPVFVPQTFGFFGGNQFNGFANPFINTGFGGVNQFAFNNGFGVNPFAFNRFNNGFGFNNGFAFANRNFAVGFNPFAFNNFNNGFNNGFAFHGNGFNRGFGNGRRGCR